MRSETSALFDSLTPNAGVCVADGFGIRVFIRRRHLVVQDGAGKHRRERTFARATARIKRLIVLGHEGFVSLEALRWMADLGIAFIHIDRDGKLIGASAPPGNDDARLRRSQALAGGTDRGLEIARWILEQKLRGQHDLLAQLGAREAQKAVKAALRGLKRVHSTDDLMSTPEARGAAAYWETWTDLPIPFVGADRQRVPNHWLSFGPRRSPLSGSPRLAFNPGNAILNYLYRLLEAETRIACIAVGLDPGLGFFHTDKRGRDNLVVDVMEACRPQVDSYALGMFRTQLFRASDFYETRKGVCRVLPPLSHQLAETSLRWARFVAPFTETVAKMLGKPRRTRDQRPPTPLTRSNRSRGRDGIRQGGVRRDLILPSAPPARRCRQCGDQAPTRTRQFCDRCVASGTLESTSVRKAAASVRVQKELAEWRQRGTRSSEAEYRRDILPRLSGLPLATIAQATGLSLAYCSRIRRGVVRPHPRHWAVLSRLGGR